MTRGTRFCNSAKVLRQPINLVAGLLGMNVGGIPLAEYPHGFWLVLAFVVALTLLVARYAFRRTAGTG